MSEATADAAAEVAAEAVKKGVEILPLVGNLIVGFGAAAGATISSVTAYKCFSEAFRMMKGTS